MDTRTVFQLTCQAIITRDPARLAVLADALEDSNMPEEAAAIRGGIEVLSGTNMTVQRICRTISTNLLNHTRREWLVRRTGMRDGHAPFITISSARDRRIARPNTRTERWLSPEDANYLRNRFTGRRMAYRMDDYAVRIPERWVYLLHAMHLSAGSECLDPRTGPNEILPAFLAYITESPPPQPPLVPEEHYLLNGVA